MTAPTANRVKPRLASSRPRRDTAALLAAADRGVIVREVRRPWPVFLVNGHSNPDVRPLIAGLIDQGLLHIVDPHAPSSEVRPTTAGLAKIGVSR